MAKTSYRTALGEVRKAFAELRQPPPRRGLAGWAAALGSVARAAMARGRAADESSRERLRVLSWLYDISGHVGYFEVWPEVMLQSVARQAEATWALGPSRERARDLCNRAAVIALLGRRGEADRVMDEAERMAESLEDNVLRAHCGVYRAYVLDFSGRCVEAAAATRACLTRQGSWLDTFDFSNLCGSQCHNLMLRGYFKECWTWAELGLQRAGRGMLHSIVLPVAASALALLGRSAEAGDALRPARLSVGGSEEGLYRSCFLHYHEMLFHMEVGDPEALDAVVDAFERRGMPPALTPHHLRSSYVVIAYVRLFQCLSATPERPRRLAQLREAVARLRRVPSLAQTDCHREILRAHLDAMDGRDEDALRRLHRAEAMAARADSRWGALEIAHLEATIHRRRGWAGAARREAERALDLALAAGWASRVQRLRREFDLDVASRSGAASSDSMGAASFTSTRRQRQLDALLQLGTAFASVFDVDQLLRLALKEILGILGAERACLFLCDEAGVLSLRAGRDAEGHDLHQVSTYSATVVEQVRATGKAVRVSGTEDGALLGSESVVAHDLRSILAAPLRMRDRRACRPWTLR